MLGIYDLTEATGKRFISRGYNFVKSNRAAVFPLLILGVFNFLPQWILKFGACKYIDYQFMPDPYFNIILNRTHLSQVSGIRFQMTTGIK